MLIRTKVIHLHFFKDDQIFWYMGSFAFVGIASNIIPLLQRKLKR